MSARRESYRVDLVSIFPDYFAPLRLSLVGRAIQDAIIDVRVHDLRDAAHDRHRTVDDTPYGGGPGMVMKPEPWGETLDAVLAQVPRGTTLVVPTPSGTPFTQRTAERYSALPGLVIACGRYEGIDARVGEHYGTRVPVEDVSVGDYVLAGGEAAALVVVEAVARLLPGVLGNEASAPDDSFAAARAGGALEGPVYTKPRSWRGLDVPPVLLSGDHGAIATWRAEQSRERTRRTRPDLGDG